MNLPWLRSVCLNLIKRAEPNGILETDAPPSVELSLMSQGDLTVVHLVDYHTEKRGGKAELLMETYSEVIEEIPAICNITVKLKAAKPKNVYLVPARQELSWEADDGWVKVVVPELKIHRMIVVEM